MSLTNNQINYISAILGFILINILFLIFAGGFEGDKSANSLFISLFGQNIHLHHWLVGFVSLIILLVLEQLIGKSLLLSFTKGLALGAIFHGLTFYSDYFKILN